MEKVAASFSNLEISDMIRKDSPSYPASLATVKR